MEPRNIGIILWANGRAAARFLNESDALFVRDRRTYRRWVNFWHDIVSSSSFAANGGRPIAKATPTFLDEILKTQKPNYLLVEGGYVADKVSARQIDDATDYLFDELVARGHWAPPPVEQAKRLKQQADFLFRDVGLSAREDFKKSFEISCKIGHVLRPFEFNYAIVNGVPKSLFQRVRVQAPQSVHSTAFMYEQILRSVLLEKSRCAALVYVSNGDGDLLRNEVASSVAMLAEFATVINLADQNQAKQQILAVAG
jgi:hypothetical protein